MKLEGKISVKTNSKGYKSYSINLPNAIVKNFNLDEENTEVEIELIEDSIIIKKKVDEEIQDIYYDMGFKVGSKLEFNQVNKFIALAKNSSVAGKLKKDILMKLVELCVSVQEPIPDKIEDYLLFIKWEMGLLNGCLNNKK
ncbi:AbrB/MazE/SpoVT family DNA-binding domain-containing protein [Clostridium thermobutyricum]|uniref:SpoVT / AbrB like domain protein n=1 Tax=Clostridium thermobutyricum DSM 4928 TaxID=1121339 RepID=A0A1V4SXH0_9CLOT|nr:AbrB/MazE/SpoVT family DNA-binding domain-containing protein [Clostridium thermobutyricum]OPX48509.1 SpoVT / AbrB like domain protein [Clostridium thermobutyricum DSM 4928]